MLMEDLFEAALGKLSCLDMSEEIESVFFTAPMEAFWKKKKKKKDCKCDEKCGNFKIFVSLKFYVKSILWILEVQN